MQTNQELLEYSQGTMRKLAWQCHISFDKTYLPSVDFFAVGNSGSAVGGPDLIPGSNSVVQEWDKYQYQDYSDRVISIELTREVEQVSSVTSCYGDLVLDNHDDMFTPGANSPLDPYLLPYRPIRLYMGFYGVVIPVFVGLTDATPVVDDKKKTVSFHLTDFLFSLFDKPLDEIVLATNVRTDEALEQVFESAGLLASQLMLDRGYNELNYFAVNKGTTVIEVLKQLMEAEQGRLYMDEQGVIHFKNRQNYLSEPVMTFDAYNNIIGASRTREDSIVNVVEINSELRALQANQKVFELTTATEIPSGTSVEIWATFSDPVSTVDPVVYVDSATTSSFTVNTLEDGSGSANSTDVTLTADDVFSTSYKMTFTNASTTQNLFVTNIQIYGTPYSVVDTLYVREQDNTSVGNYDERVLQLDNDFFQDRSQAQSKAQILLDGYSGFAAVQQLEVKGTPQLQLDDPLRIDIFGRIETVRITKIEMGMSDGVFDQTLRVKSFTPRSYFRVGDSGSSVGGLDYVSF